jgi:hypothetical protein
MSDSFAARVDHTRGKYADNLAAGAPKRAEQGKKLSHDIPKNR